MAGIYREWRVTCPCGDLIYQGDDWLEVIRAATDNVDDRFPGAPNVIEGRTVLPWIRLGSPE